MTIAVECDVKPYSTNQSFKLSYLAHMFPYWYDVYDNYTLHDIVSS